MALDPKDPRISQIISEYVKTASGRSKLAQAMVEPIRRRRYDGIPETCPHDGRYCAHQCENECKREVSGESMTPRPGYPIDSDEYFRLKVINQVLDS